MWIKWLWEKCVCDWQAACAVVGECNLRWPPPPGSCTCVVGACVSSARTVYSVSLSTGHRAMCSELLFHLAIMFKLCLEIWSLLQGHQCWCLESVPPQLLWSGLTVASDLVKSWPTSVLPCVPALPLVPWVELTQWRKYMAQAINTRGLFWRWLMAVWVGWSSKDRQSFGLDTGVWCVSSCSGLEPCRAASSFPSGF